MAAYEAEQYGGWHILLYPASQPFCVLLMFFRDDAVTGVRYTQMYRLPESLLPGRRLNFLLVFQQTRIRYVYKMFDSMVFMIAKSGMNCYNNNSN